MYGNEVKSSGAGSCCLKQEQDTAWQPISGNLLPWEAKLLSLAAFLLCDVQHLAKELCRASDRRLESWAALQGGQQRIEKLDEITVIRLNTSRSNHTFQEDKKR